MSTRNEIFDYIYSNGIWNDKISSIPLSGSGSIPDKTKKFRVFLDKFCLENNVSSFLDLGCGDLAWLPLTDVFKTLKYTGVDIVASLIETHKLSYPTKQFICTDIVTDTIPTSDAILIRDVLFHLKIDDVSTILKKIVDGKLCKFLIVTSCRNNKNTDDFDQYFYHPLNLLIAPFYLSNSFEAFPEDEFNRDILFFKIS